MKDKESGFFSCRNTSWIAGALLGFTVFLLIGGLWGVLVGLVAAVVIALVLVRLFCAGAGAEEAMYVPAVAPDVAVETGAGAAPGLAHDPEAEAAAEAAASAMTGDEEVAASIAGDAGRVTVATMLDEAAVEAEEPEQVPGEAVLEEEVEGLEKAEAEKPKAAEPETSASKTATATEKPAQKPVAADGKPEMLAEPEGEADDLKMIKGVGPKLEALLHSLGFFHFDQIAKWTEAEVAWVDENLTGFKGRVSRDDWVAQARLLAAGEQTEFSKKVKDGDVYKT